uniref:ATP synthase F0 subunit 8 n=1 Tax=Apalus guerini TaxID=2914700 RepID=UPI001FA80816|nr:ATP synthase F0 subunit 8 [Apalus guerini]UMR54798.1 ATP synthase F0 subunit 8 [Apalus guerini]
MPQMAPLNWLTLMLYFICLLSLVSSLNFYSFIYLKKESTIKPHLSIKMTWKWL